MKKLISSLICDMVQYETACPERVGHFLKVYSFAAAIAKKERLTEDERLTVEVASLLHDVGIRPSLEKYRSSAGGYQEELGPPVAAAILRKYALDPALVDRVCFLIGHHHSYGKIDGIDFQILVEADFLVNIAEEGLTKQQIESVKRNYFKTETGKSFVEAIYPAAPAES